MLTLTINLTLPLRDDRCLGAVACEARPSWTLRFGRSGHCALEIHTTHCIFFVKNPLICMYRTDSRPGKRKTQGERVLRSTQRSGESRLQSLHGRLRYNPVSAGAMFVCLYSSGERWCPQHFWCNRSPILHFPRTFRLSFSWASFERASIFV